ncbi:hypothetical protein [Nitrosomonas supralitoralis]|uniref:Uncharacterized protein n=1 Tax=Nitrosomonas supralitoralis TaxID=2116706 RepID=A0A2P7NTQ3_9PROT|nr:hypothetical protein [Nitrosomonas supralitoralis]PSJ16851.1 hypothetical protein C7H79_11270 [Nitrosomonas supralitoralis]
MNLSTLKGILIPFFGLMVAHVGTTSAHNQAGGCSTGLAAAIDFYQIACFDAAMAMARHSISKRKSEI